MSIPENFHLNPLKSVESFQALSEDEQQEVLERTYQEDTERDLTGPLTIITQNRTYEFGAPDGNGRRAVVSCEPPHPNENIRQLLAEAPVHIEGRKDLAAGGVVEDGRPMRLWGLSLRIGAAMYKGTMEQCNFFNTTTVLGINPEPQEPTQA